MVSGPILDTSISNLIDTIGFDTLVKVSLNASLGFGIV